MIEYEVLNELFSNEDIIVNKKDFKIIKKIYEFFN